MSRSDAVSSTGELVDISTMFGRWHLVATTNGYFTLRQRIDSAVFEIGPLVRGRVRYRVDFELRGRPRRIRGTIVAGKAGSGQYGWRGRGALLLAARSQWRFARSADGAVVCFINPGSMMTEPGALLLRREGVSPQAAKPVILEQGHQLGLTRQQLEELAWRS